MQGQIVDIFSVLFADLLPLTLIMFFIVLFYQLLSPNTMKKILGFGIGSDNAKEKKPKPEKAIMECYGCSEPFKKKDVFCGHCGNEL